MPRLSSIFWLSLLALTLLVRPVSAQDDPAAPGETRQITGLGLTVELAKKDALDQAYKAALKVAAHVHRRHPSLADWEPSLAFVENTWIKGPGELGKEVVVDEKQKVIAKSWTLTLKPPDLDSLTTLARVEQRLHRSDERLRWGLWTLPLLVIGLVILAGTIRLERGTQGRFSFWLRGAALTAAAIAGAAWWWAKDFVWTKI